MSQEAIIVSNKIKFIRLIWCGNDSIIRTKCVHREAFQNILEGGIALTRGFQGLLSMQDSIAEGSGLSAVGDVWMIPDLNTYCVVPFHPSHGMALVNICSNDMKTSPLCPRNAARIQLVELKCLGFDLYSGFENEFHLLKQGDLSNQKPIPVEQTTYCQTVALHHMANILDEIEEAITDIGGKLWLLHPESSNGQFEISLQKLQGMKAADMQIYLHELIKGIASKNNLRASFLPKIFENQAGNGCHLHISLWKDNRNMFLDKCENMNNENSVNWPQEVQCFISGILHHLPAIMAVSCATKNSYRRIQPNFWAGAYQCWGTENKEAALRAPRDPVTGKCSRIEIKVADGTGNPHLIVAAIVGAGIHGIKSKLSLPPSLEINPHDMSDDERTKLGIFRLPSSFEEALQSLENDDVILNALGNSIAKSYIAVKRAELQILDNKSFDEEVSILCDKY